MIRLCCDVAQMLRSTKIHCSRLPPTAGVGLLALMPFIPAGKAYQPMNTNHFTTFRTKPFLFFIPDEMSNPRFINHFEIVDHAHSIPLSVALIQLFQPGTWKTTTTIGTILAFAICDLFAISNSTSIAVF